MSLKRKVRELGGRALALKEPLLVRLCRSLAISPFAHSQARILPSPLSRTRFSSSLEKTLPLSTNEVSGSLGATVLFRPASPFQVVLIENVASL